MMPSAGDSELKRAINEAAGLRKTERITLETTPAKLDDEKTSGSVVLQEKESAKTRLMDEWCCWSNLKSIYDVLGAFPNECLRKDRRRSDERI